MSALNQLGQMASSIRTGSERLASFFRHKLVDGMSVNPGKILAPAARTLGVLMVTGMIALGSAAPANAQYYNSYPSTNISTQFAINNAIMTSVILAAAADEDAMNSRMEAAYMDCMIDWAEEHGYNGSDGFDVEKIKACAEVNYANKGFERTYEIVAKAELAGEADWEKRPSDKDVAARVESKKTADKVALGIVGGLGIGVLGFMGWMVYDMNRWRVATPSFLRRRREKLDAAGKAQGNGPDQPGM